MAKTSAPLLDPILDPQPEPYGTDRIFVVLRAPLVPVVQSIVDSVFGPDYCIVDNTHCLCTPPRDEPGSEWNVTGRGLNFLMRKSERRRFLTALAVRFPLDARPMLPGETPNLARDLWTFEGEIVDKRREGWEFYAATEAAGFCEPPESLP